MFSPFTTVGCWLFSSCRLLAPAFNYSPPSCSFHDHHFLKDHYYASEVASKPTSHIGFALQRFGLWRPRVRCFCFSSIRDHFMTRLWIKGSRRLNRLRMNRALICCLSHHSKLSLALLHTPEFTFHQPSPDSDADSQMTSQLQTNAKTSSSLLPLQF